MKSPKPFMFVLAGMLITVALFSFKNETPKKEYLLAEFHNYNGYWTITKPDLTEITTEKSKEWKKERVKLMNNLANEGWELKQANYDDYTIYLHFERVKQ